MAAERFNVRLDIDGDEQYARGFLLYAHETGDLSTPFARMGHRIVEAVGEQFLTEGERSGRPWPALSRAYAAWKREHFGPNPLLVATGEMRREMLDESRAITVSPDRLVYEPKGERADEGIPFFHQHGKGHNPQRKMVDLTLDDHRGFDRVMARWLNEVRRGAIGAPR